MVGVIPSMLQHASAEVGATYSLARSIRARQRGMLQL
jgi:hypothetical protein